MGIGENSKGKLSNAKTILVAEDNDLSYMYLEIVLNNAGYNVLHARNGQEAVDLCVEYPEICLALIDIKMPIMNGLDAAIKIKKLRADLPVVAQTAYALLSDKKLFDNYGFDEYITKPIRKDYLIEVVKKYI